MNVSFEEFRELVREVIEAIPDPFADHLSAVPVLVADVHPDHPGVLGLYTGVPLTVREGGPPLQPSVIHVFMRPLVALSPDRETLREQVRITVLHELGHHLGMDEDDLDRVGYS